jgi:dnd system-associated protein 4
MRDRIRPARSHGKLLEQLIDDNVFVNFEKAFVFAAALGYCLKPDSTVEPQDPGAREIPISVFRNSDDDGFIDLLAVTVRATLDVLNADRADERLEIVEHFASIGFDYVQKHCYEPGRDPLQGVLNIIDRFSAKDGDREKLPGLEANARKISKMF